MAGPPLYDETVARLLFDPASPARHYLYGHDAPTLEMRPMGDHHDDDGDGVADQGGYRARLRQQLADVDWDGARVESRPVEDELVSVDHDEDHAHDDAVPVEDGDRLDELTEDGGIDQGVFGDGAYVPSHWWSV